jgi:two-component system chemotaxis sensor kinase CheA
MSNSNDEADFLKELIADFKIEASEHYNTILTSLLTIYDSSNSINSKEEVIGDAYRSTHSLKGSARAVDQEYIEKICSSLESIFSIVIKEKYDLDKDTISDLFKVLEILKSLIDNIGKESSSVHKIMLGRAHEILSKTILNFKKNESLPIINTSEQNDITEKNSLDIDIKKQTEIKESNIIRVPVDQMLSILSQAEELITIKNSLARLCEKDSIEELHSEISILYNNSSKIIYPLIENIKENLLSNFESISLLIKKIVFELSSQLSKDISLTIIGEKTSIDKRVLERIKDPLIHIIRNAVDHGIELTKDRTLSGKTPKGSISITIEKRGNKDIQITITDDGKGIDNEKIIKSAIEKEIITKEEASQYTDDQIISLILKSGITSKDDVSDISGRGMGMSIVYEQITKLGGSVHIKSQKKQGTTLSLIIPQTVNIINGITIQLNNRDYILPINSVEKIVSLSQLQIETLGRKRYISNIYDTPVEIFYLSDILKLEINRAKDSSRFIAIVTDDNYKIALIIDNLKTTYEGLIKEMGSQILKIRYLSGVAVGSQGEIMPILNIPEIIRAITDYKSNNNRSIDSFSKNDINGKTSIKTKVMVVEDSITIRNILKNYLSSGGFDVITAVDGEDAYNQLKRDNVDIVVSDIEMPRMNGFLLTKSIRSGIEVDPNIPIILVSALEKDDDIKRGLECGANAYIIKSNFEKSNLIETINRLI